MNSLKLPNLFIALCFSASALASGEVTFIKGTFTALSLNSKQKTHELKAGDKVGDRHSYFTHESSQAVIKLEDGTWLRLGTETKIEIKKFPEHHQVKLIAGTLRLMYAPKLGNATTKNLVILTEDAQVQTSGAKMTVTHIPLFEHTSVYVEKGLAQLANLQTSDAQVPELIHAGEFSEFVKSEKAPRKAQTMSEKHLAFLKMHHVNQLKNKDI